ncbi:nucleotidyltransferase [Clostridium aestuarii]|uniref:tRNA(Met) cytidine acetate ligase n=1 Tax=Clostridium aestuarii TaxID=338193 RepID=A0ABT4CYC9_9CLOT|nr:nucleotidyltransferase [Clostridium aestuarii]MCY6483986.1 nucleotidyltransferase [Clostridium aestuarii]
MNITGIITEYNPLHNGHLYHIINSKKITKCDGVVCVMSGNFVQRGTPAIIDKWNRTKLALANGVDLVIELPSIYSLSSAEFFAYGAVSLLNNLGNINNLCFGSESGNINTIKEIAKILVEEPDDFKYNLKLSLDKGISFPLARSSALSKCFDDNSHISEILNSSNNILAIEYCKSLIKLNSTIIPFTIHRKGSSYNNLNIDNIFCSASAIRKHLKENRDIASLKSVIPSETYDILKKMQQKNSLTFEEEIFKYIKYKIFTTNNKLENIPDVSEGLHNKIYKCIKDSINYTDLILNVKSKRYTQTRINRILCQYFIGFDEYNTQTLRKASCPYARILGFNKKGQEILRKFKISSSIPLYTKLPKQRNEVLNLEIQSTQAYSLLNKTISPYDDYKISPIRLL